MNALKIFIAIASTSTSGNTKVILLMENNLCTKCLFYKLMTIHSLSEIQKLIKNEARKYSMI